MKTKVKKMITLKLSQNTNKTVHHRVVEKDLSKRSSSKNLFIK